MLILVRHGESEWNALNQFTGWTDVPLTEKGCAEAQAAGREIKARGLVPDLVYTSVLKRAMDTAALILEQLGAAPEIRRSEKLNERDYGDLTGMNKDTARARFGEEQVHIWRRSYDIAPPGGESLKDVVARVLPYFENEILPELRAGRTVMVAAHGNSLRALVKGIEDMTDEQVLALELPTGAPRYYETDGADGLRLSGPGPR
jgi:2,3-bisphosphoglycerate-dependent phosphoglycerate mutase